MRGITILENPPTFKTFHLAHRIEGGRHIFEVAYGSSFSELYYEFTPEEFLKSADKEELSLQFNRVGVGWLIPLLESLAYGSASITTDQLISKVVNSQLDA